MYKKNNNMKSNNFFIYFFLFFIVATLFSCNSKTESNKQWKDPESVEVKESDLSVQYYLPLNNRVIVTGEPFTINDLQASGRLLLTSGGNIKAMEFSDGYKIVYSFRCEPIGRGWYKITCWLKSPITGEEYTQMCYTREKI